MTACDSTQDFKGEIIPESKTISSLLNTDKSQTQKAISYLNQILEDGQSSHVYYLRAKYLFEARQYKKANEDILKAIKSSPRDVEYVLLAGQIAFDLENYTTASSYLNLIKSNLKKRPLMLFLLADLSIKVDNLKLANYYLNQISPKDLSAKDQFYYLILKDFCLPNKLSNTYLIRSLDQKMIQDVRLQRLYLANALDFTSKYLYQNQLLKLMNENPNDPHLLRFWARFLNKINQNKMAELTYQKVVSQFEHNDRLFLEIANFYMSHRNYSQAFFYLNKIKPDLDFFLDVPFLKSKCYLYLGDNIHYKSTMDSVRFVMKNDARFYQFKMKHFGISMDSSFAVKDSLLTIRP